MSLLTEFLLAGLLMEKEKVGKPATTVPEQFSPQTC